MSDIAINSEDFQKEIKDHKGLALVDFWASWCGPCMMLAPIIEEVAKEFEGKVKVRKIQLDDEKHGDKNQELSSQYDVSGIPAMIVFKDGEKIDQIVGAVPKETIVEKLNGHLEK